ncbi:MAG: SIMPL domain-containing protein, partial [Allobranchiibius sp.]
MDEPDWVLPRLAEAILIIKARTAGYVRTMTLTIRVRETASKYVPAERAELRLAVSAEGPSKAEIAERTRATLERVVGELQALQE